MKPRTGFEPVDASSLAPSFTTSDAPAPSLYVSVPVSVPYTSNTETLIDPIEQRTLYPAISGYRVEDQALFVEDQTLPDAHQSPPAAYHTIVVANQDAVVNQTNLVTNQALSVMDQTVDFADQTLPSCDKVFLFMDLPRELRDDIYSLVFALPDSRSQRALRIERRHLTNIDPTPAGILTILHQEDVLWNRQTAREALEVLFKRHTVFFSCGPWVLKRFLDIIEEGKPYMNGNKLEKRNSHTGLTAEQIISLSLDPSGATVVGWLKHISLDWVTFPNLRYYPPWHDTRHQNVEGSWDYSGASAEYYDDNYYTDRSGHAPLWSDSYHDALDAREDAAQPPFADEDPSAAHDPFGFDTHYPFSDPEAEPQFEESTAFDARTALDLLIAAEVTPLFARLATPPLALTSITMPLFFISREKWASRRHRLDAPLPLRIRYWTKVVAHALVMLLGETVGPAAPTCSWGKASTLREVKVLYGPHDIWASMAPTDDLGRLAAEGLWGEEGFAFREGEGEGEAWRAVAQECEERGTLWGPETAVEEMKLVKWTLDGGERPGDWVEVVVRKK